MGEETGRCVFACVGWRDGGVGGGGEGAMVGGGGGGGGGLQAD